MKDKDMKQLKEQLQKYNTQFSKLTKMRKSKEFSKQLDAFKEKLAEAKDSYENLKETSEDSWEEVKASTMDIFTNVKEAFQELTKGFTPDQLKEVTDDAMEYSQNKLEEMQTFIKEKPFVSTLFALGLGVVLGMIYRRS